MAKRRRFTAKFKAKARAALEALREERTVQRIAARQVIGEWIAFYNQIRPHSALDGRTQWGVLQATDSTEAGRGRDS